MQLKLLKAPPRTSLSSRKPPIPGVGTKLVASLAQPGGNITGLSILSPELSGKRLELLKEAVPKISRIAVMLNSTTPNTQVDLKETEAAARSLRVKPR